jgi:hypothetical protein
MSYSVHITRANNWCAAQEQPISEEEWLAAVEQDPTLSINKDDYYEYKTEGEKAKRIHPVEWAEAEDKNCLWWGRGQIECKNPSDAWVAKMVALAMRLNAKVVGDEGEQYQ